MALEDFFTLTEMKDGLTAAARVEELVVAMQKEKDVVMKNVGDTSRQWAAVASAIAATENKESLDLFIQLEGLWFIDRWLKEAQVFADKASACFVEEAICSLLIAVKKLQIDNERLVSSGICNTVKGLLSYESSRIQDSARALFDSWKLKEVDIKRNDLENTPVSDDAKHIGEHLEIQSIPKDASPARTPVDQISEGLDRQIVKLTNEQDGSRIASNPSKSIDDLPGSAASPVKGGSVLNDYCVKELLHSSDVKLNPLFPEAPKQGTSDVIPDKCNLMRSDGKLNPLFDEASKHGTGDVIPDKCNLLGGEGRPDNKLVDSCSDSHLEVSSSSVAAADVGDISCGAVANTAEKLVNQPGTGAFDGNDGLILKSTSPSDIDEPVGKLTKDSDDGLSLEPKVLDVSVGSSLVETKDPQITLSGLAEVRKDDGVKQCQKSIKKRFGKRRKFSRLTRNRKCSNIIQQTAEMDLEDGTFDALEVACLVANEVAKEIVDYEEKSGSSSSSFSSSSSSERMSTGDSRQPGSLECESGGEHLQLEDPINEVPMTGELLPSINPATVETTLENHLQDTESFQVTDAAHEQENNAKKAFLAFDLNQEFSSEDVDQNQADTISNPVSVVQASRAALALGIPENPLTFEGSLGWKGSAATSAFRPASPHLASDRDKALSGGGTSSGSKQRQDFLDIDLNIKEGEDDKLVHVMPNKQTHLLINQPSGESSVELSPKTSKKLMFDLNQIEEDITVPVSQWKISGHTLGFHKHQRSPSPASSSSCMQPATRNFDLNDNPSNDRDSSDLHHFLVESPSNKVHPFIGHQDDSVISILGTKVKKSTIPSQSLFPIPNGKASESLVDQRLFGGSPLMGTVPAVPYPQSVYGYNGLAMSTAVPFSAPIYGQPGPIPYILDSRGSPIVPQIVGAPSAVPSSYGQPSLLMNIMGATPTPNITGPLRPNVDLNPGYAFDVGNRDPSFFRQLFISGQVMPLDNQLCPRPMSSGASGSKRKEPDSAWELYAGNYKHHQPPHL